jgi:hypothetical protein
MREPSDLAQVTAFALQKPVRSAGAGATVTVPAHAAESEEEATPETNRLSGSRRVEFAKV